MAISAESRKQPCTQCRAHYNYEYKRGEYAEYETAEGVEFRTWTNCCGKWVISFPARTEKLAYRRPRFNENF